MKVTLGKRWELTTDHAASSYGQPVLVNRATGDAYGPLDLVQPYPSWGLLPAAATVSRLAARLAATAPLTAEETELVERFTRRVSVDG